LVRVRRVHDAKVVLHRGRIALITIEADSGLYIKELVSGDEGRTNPSLSGLLGVKAFVEKLDVIDVKGGLYESSRKV
jgi:tRNA pseudouridine synthase 10